MDHGNDKVSIIIPTYNRYDFLLRAVESVNSQTYTNKELIIVDDCSTDPRYTTDLQNDVAKICTTVPVTIKRLPVNLKEIHNTPHYSCACQGLTRNEGIYIARGEWLAFLDDDDYWIDPDKLSKQLQAMKQNNAQFCTTNMINKHGIHNKPPETKFITDITHWNSIATSTVVIRTDLIKQVGLFRHVPNEDADCWKKVLNITPCLFLDINTTYYTLDNPKYY